MARLIIYVTYGTESETFVKAKHLWSFLASYCHDIDVYFVRWDQNLPAEGVAVSGNEIMIGLPPGLLSDDLGYSNQNPQWSIRQNIAFIHRHLKIYEFINRNYSGKYWIYAPTVTTVVDPRSLLQLTNSLECRNFFGGAPLALNFGNSIFWALSGAGILISSDLLVHALDHRADYSHELANDVWLSLLLASIPRTPLPRFDMGSSEAALAETLTSLSARVRDEIAAGCFHFRANSLPLLADKNARASIDPLLLCQTVATILSSSPATITPIDCALHRYHSYLVQHNARFTNSGASFMALS